MHQEKGVELRVVEFFEDQIKKYEFQLGITPAILEESLVREQQRYMENKERGFQHKKPFLEEDVDTIDLGTTAAAGQNKNLNESKFAPPKINNLGITIDQNQTIKLPIDDSMASGRLVAQINGQPVQPRGAAGNAGGGNETTVNDTMAGIVATLNREDNDRSETGGDDYMDENMLKEKRAENMDLGGPGGTGSSASAPLRSSQ